MIPSWRALWWRVRLWWRARKHPLRECGECGMPLLPEEHVRCEACHGKWLLQSREVRLPENVKGRALVICDGIEDVVDVTPGAVIRVPRHATLEYFVR